MLLFFARSLDMFLCLCGKSICSLATRYFFTFVVFATAALLLFFSPPFGLCCRILLIHAFSHYRMRRTTEDLKAWPVHSRHARNHKLIAAVYSFDSECKNMQNLHQWFICSWNLPQISSSFAPSSLPCLAIAIQPTKTPTSLFYRFILCSHHCICVRLFTLPQNIPGIIICTDYHKHPTWYVFRSHCEVAQCIAK